MGGEDGHSVYTNVPQKAKKMHILKLFNCFFEFNRRRRSIWYRFIPDTSQVNFWSQVNRCWLFVDLFWSQFNRCWPFLTISLLFYAIFHKERCLWPSTWLERKIWKFWKWIILWKIHSRELLNMCLNSLDFDYHVISMRGYFKKNYQNSIIWNFHFWPFPYCFMLFFRLAFFQQKTNFGSFFWNTYASK